MSIDEERFGQAMTAALDGPEREGVEFRNTSCTFGRLRGSERNLGSRGLWQAQSPRHNPCARRRHPRQYDHDDR